jgi:CcmD family protein
MMMKRVLLAIGAMLSAGTAFAFQPPSGLEGFTPIDKLPPSDQLPAAPLLITAYAFVWLAVFFYVWTVGRRLNKVETEMRTLEQRQAKPSSTR